MVIAFIPVRGGSKSIPLKNIRPFCGKPLVCWVIEALEACTHVDAIIVATDSEQIEHTVSARKYTKTSIYHRSAENASDTASTESVMLEYIHVADLPSDCIFMLVQATSPLTQTIHFSEALKMYGTNTFDSILTCVRSRRFYWNANGSPLNYDYKNRPRRQNFDGTFVENGAFYINTVANIVESNNRLSGKIGIYEMPGYTATEIDEPEDWNILEDCMYRHVLRNRNKGYQDLKLFMTDVDGTLTDAGMYYTENGDELKKFNTRDGMGLQLLQKTGVKVGIVTSENTKMVERRAAKLKVDFLSQGKRDGGKLAAVQDICNTMGITLQNVAYIGDDVNCKDLLSAVGYRACPADAQAEIQAIPNIHILSKKGGEGCVREWIDSILQEKKKD